MEIGSAIDGPCFDWPAIRMHIRSCQRGGVLCVVPDDLHTSQSFFAMRIALLRLGLSMQGGRSQAVDNIVAVESCP